RPLAVVLDTGPVVGAAPLTPAQHWFRYVGAADPRRFDQSVTLTLTPGVDLDALDRALRALVVRHDALRMRFDVSGEDWHQVNAAPEDRAVLCVDGPDGDGFDLTSGRLLTAVLRTGERPRLRLAAHHLVVDGVSWRILIEDLDTAYRQAAA